MKALVKTKPGLGNVEIKNVREPEIKHDEVLVKIKASGICGTDIILYDWTYEGRSSVSPPVILGHEGAGEVVKVGNDVKDIRVGDSVGLVAINGCGNCYYCKMGLINLCQNWIHLGINKDGTHAEYVAVPKDMIHVLPDSLPLEEAVFIEPISVVVNTIEKIGSCAGRSVAIIGAGPLGLFHLQVVKTAGASFTIVTELKDGVERLRIAEKLGADVTLYSDSGVNIADKIKDLTDGLGVDIVIECGGTSEAVSQALKMVRGGGMAVLVGFTKQAQISPLSIVRGEITIVGVDGSVWRHYKRAIQLLCAKRILAKPIITHKLPLDDGVEGIKLMREKKAAKVLLYSN
jgi:2-desacetyl-2-hydroxyethyl bacteriochlorophyllide A dehydrogenase